MGLAVPKLSFGGGADEISFGARFRAWWDGYELSAGAEEDIPDLDDDVRSMRPRGARPMRAGDARPMSPRDTQPGDGPGSGENWTKARRMIAQSIWGDGFVLPGGCDYVRDLVSAFSLDAADAVLEIGAGLGVLTCALADVAARVVSLEVDAGLVGALVAERSLPANVELRHEDALRADLAGLLPPSGTARVVANLPYAIAAPLLRRLLDLRERLEGWSVMVQREVAQRLEAGPGSRDYGSLAVLHRLSVRVESGLDLHPRCFYPVPRVTSRFLCLRPLPDPILSPGELPGVERVVRAAFRHRRKTLVNSLRSALEDVPPPELVSAALASLGRQPSIRAEQLEPEELLELARRLTDAASVEGSPHG